MRVVGNRVQYRERYSNRKLIFGHIFRQHRLILSALVLGYPVLYITSGVLMEKIYST